MTLRKSFITFCTLCLVMGMAQMAVAQDILVIYDSTGGGTRYAGNVWGINNNLSHGDGLAEAFRGIIPGADVDLYDFGTGDPQGIMGSAFETSTTEKQAWLNTYDLIYLDASPGSGSVRSQADEWNGVTTALFTTKTFLPQDGRWEWFDGGSPSTDGMATTPTEFVTVGSSQVRLFDRAERYDVSCVQSGGNGAGDVLTTLSAISQRAYSTDMDFSNADDWGTFPGFDPAAAGEEVVAWAKWTNVSGTFHTSTTQVVGGPRLFAGIADDRIMYDPALSGLGSDGDKKSANVFEVLSDEGKAWLRQQLLDIAPGLAREARILVVGAYGADSNNGSGINGGRHYGYVFGPNLNETYESQTIQLMEEFFSPNAAVDFYDISESDYENLVGMTATTTTQIAFLEGYDLVVVGHSCPTNTVANNATRSAAWNSVSKPVVLFGQYAAGNNSNRWAWIPEGSPSDNAGTTPTTVLDVNDSGHPAFANVDVSGGTLRLYPEAPYTPNSNWFSAGSTNSGLVSLGQRSAINNLVGNNGNRIAEFQGVTNWCNIIVWEGADIGQPFYTGSPQVAGGPRVLLNIMDNRNQIDPTLVGGANKGYNTLALLTAEGKQMIKDLIVNMSSVPLPVELGSFELE